MIIGILSPAGEFYKCNNFGHMKLAETICKNERFEVKSGETYEQELLQRDYIVFRARDCYKNVGRGYELSDEQLAFIIKNKENWNNLEQEKYVLDLIADSNREAEYRRRR